MAITYSKFNNFFYFLTTIGRKTITRGFLRRLKMVINSDFDNSQHVCLSYGKLSDVVQF